VDNLWEEALGGLDDETLCSWLKGYADTISSSKSRPQAATEAARELKVTIVDVHRALKEAAWARQAVVEIEEAVAFFEGARAVEPPPPRGATGSDLEDVLPK
jgi:hypothetical protein